MSSTASSPEVVKVPLADGRDYPIYIGADLLLTHSDTLSQHALGKNVLVVSNDKIAPIYMDRVVGKEEGSSLWLFASAAHCSVLTNFRARFAPLSLQQFLRRLERLSIQSSSLMARR